LIEDQKELMEDNNYHDSHPGRRNVRSMKNRRMKRRFLRRESCP